jgi:uncharacterized protein YrrD
MLLLGSSFEKIPLLSLRIGSRVGSVVGHLINPHSLKIDALWVKIGGFKEPHLLLIQDIREVSLKGVVIDDHDVVILPEDALRLKPIIDLHFELLDKKVMSSRISLGRVADYALDRDSFFIQKLYVSPTAWKKLQSSRLTIDRAQIIEVSQTHIKVHGSEVKESLPLSRKLRQPSLSSMPSASASTIEE